MSDRGPKGVKKLKPSRRGRRELDERLRAYLVAAGATLVAGPHASGGFVPSGSEPTPPAAMSGESPITGPTAKKRAKKAKRKAVKKTFGYNSKKKTAKKKATKKSLSVGFTDQGDDFDIRMAKSLTPPDFARISPDVFGKKRKATKKKSGSSLTTALQDEGVFVAGFATELISGFPTFRATRLEKGDVVDETLPFNYAAYFGAQIVMRTATSYYVPFAAPYGDWVGEGVKYLGLYTLDEDFEKHFGWMSLEVFEDAGDGLLKMFVDEVVVAEEPDAFILAGDVPEPGSLALLALGAVGTLAWRPRRRRPELRRPAATIDAG